MSTSSKTAIGSMMCALSVIVMLPSVFNSLSYLMPAICGIIILFCVIELGKSWAAGVYAAVSILSFLVIPNKEAVIMYILFLGYYPILKALIEGRLPLPVQYLLKFAVFNLAMVAAVFVLNKVLGMPIDKILDVDEKYTFLKKHAAAAFLIAGNIGFIFLDFTYTSAVSIYLKMIQKRFHKLFRFK